MSLRARLARLQAEGRLPSIVGGVLRGGELAETAAVNGSVDDRYRIGSITKTITAVTVLQLRDEGAVSLEDPIGRVVPETGYADATVRSLLAHTSGMQSEPFGSWWERSPGVDFATLVAANDGRGAVATAGEYFHYTNLGFALLGEMVARLRGESWWQVVATRVLTPLAMLHTTYDDAMSDTVAPAAQGWSVDHFAGTLTREPHQDTQAMAPAGQLWSTVADLARFATFLSQGHPDVLALGSAREMATAASETYGLGLALLDVGGRRLIGHSGSMPGFLASVFVDPVSGDGAIALANATTGLNTTAAPAALLADGTVESVEPWVPTEAVPAPVMPALGLWFWGNTAIELRWHNELLQLRFVQSGQLNDVFEPRDGRLVGVSGYHRGETLHVIGRPDGAVTHLECATFVYTRVPYDPGVPIPGGHPD